MDTGVADERRRLFPLGGAATLRDFEQPYWLLSELRRREPVSWVPAQGGWLVTSRALVLEVMRDSERFTVEDPRFTTGVLVGPSMLTLEGAEHTRHRAPFAPPFRLAPVRERFTALVAKHVSALIERFAGRGNAELRGELAAPLAASVVLDALGLGDQDPAQVLGWYEEISSAVTLLTAGEPLPPAGPRSYELLAQAMDGAIEASPDASLLAAVSAHAQGLTRAQVKSNAAVMMFGGIETTEGMILNAALHLLDDPLQLEAARADPRLLGGAIEESLRLEPAAAVIDRYAATDLEVAGAQIGRRELVRLSLLAANRDPASFPDPDRFIPGRVNARQHFAFAHGPHVCIGMHLARMETRIALTQLLGRLRGLRLAGDPPPVEGLVFRKPRVLEVEWEAA